MNSELARLADLFAELDAEIARPWHQPPMAKRGHDAVMARLNGWAAKPLGPTILYWLGHGWSNGRTAALAHAHSPAAVDTEGITPKQLARKIARWETELERPAWLLVVIDACQSARFAELLAAAVDNQQGPRRVAIIGTSGPGATTLGRFTDALATALTWTFADQPSIPVGRLCDELARTVDGGARRILNLHSDAVLYRRAPQLTGYTGPLDIRATLATVLADLSDDERRHFLVKAQGGDLSSDGDDLGEVSWYFTGRESERRTILAKLSSITGGLIVVTGRAGSGKSALLGDVLVRSLPGLAAVLYGHGLLEPVTGPSPPPFDITLHLTGLDSADVVKRICRDLGRDLPDPDAPLTARVDHISRVLSRRPRLILADALDEAVDPLTMASLLRTLASIPGVRVLVGTRRSVNEHPDQPESDDTDLLDALGAADPISIVRDTDAITRYVTRRLAPRTDGHTAARAAAAIAEADQEFLYARLATHELLVSPALLGNPARITELIGATYRSVFATALGRLAYRNPAYQALLVALALAQGRGAPIRDGVWTTIARTISDTAIYERRRPAIRPTVTDADITALLSDAAPYLSLDSEHGQTVYRLAHRTFAEHFGADPDIVRSQHELLVPAAVAAIRTATSDSQTPPPNDYWVHHTSSHAALGGPTAWQELDGAADILDQLDPDAIAADAMRTLFGQDNVPSNIAGIISALHELRTADPTDRPGLRQLATARQADITAPTSGPSGQSTWLVSWARVRKQPLHVTYAGHAGGIWAVAAVKLPDGRTLVATGGSDSVVRLWDPIRGTGVGEPLTGHTRAVLAIAAFVSRDGRVLLATAGYDDTVRFWDPMRGTAVARPLTGFTRGVREIAVIQLADGHTLLAITGLDETVGIWDPATGTSAGVLRTRGSAVGRTTTAVRFPSFAGTGDTGQTVLATCGDDRVIRLWDPTFGTRGRWRNSVRRKPIGKWQTGDTQRVLAMAALELPKGRTLLATAGHDKAVRLWDPISGTQVGHPLIGHTDSVLAIAAFDLSDGRTLLATAGYDATVRLWDPQQGTHLGEPWTVHDQAVRAVAVVKLQAGTLLATGSDDGTLRLWDPIRSTLTSPANQPFTNAIAAMTAVELADGRELLVTAGYDKTVQVWDAALGTPVGEPFKGWAKDLAVVSLPDGRVLLAIARGDRRLRLMDLMNGTPVGSLIGYDVSAVAAVRLPDGRSLLATAGNREVQLWDPLLAKPVGERLTGHQGLVLGLTTVRLPDGRTLLAAVGDDQTLRMWDLMRGTPVGEPMTGHSNAVSTVVAIDTPDGPRIATASDDRTVRMWDPIRGTPMGEPLSGRNHATTAGMRRQGDSRREAAWAGGVPVNPAFRDAAVAAVPLPNGRTLLATAGGLGSDDKTVQLWDPTTGAKYKTLRINQRITSLCSLRAGRLALGLTSGIVVIALPTSTLSA